MDPKIEQRFLDLENQIKENNTLIHKLYLTQRLNLILRSVYWLVLIGLSVGAFYFLQPFLGRLETLYSMSGSGNIQNINTILQKLKTTSGAAFQ